MDKKITFHGHGRNPQYFNNASDALPTELPWWLSPPYALQGIYICAFKSGSGGRRCRYPLTLTAMARGQEGGGLKEEGQGG